MKTYRIALIPGDGIGQEVAPQGVRVLDSVAQAAGSFRLDYETFPWGCTYYLEHGRMIAEDALQRLQGFDAIYFGAVGFPTVPITSPFEVCDCRSARASTN